MRITRRTSGGRGEYEISEDSPDGVTPNDLLGRRIVLQLPNGLQIDTATQLTAQGGKRRLRMVNAEMQVHKQLATALMLPEPVRANAALGAGAPVIQKGRYAIEHITVGGVDLAVETATLHVADVILRNQSSTAEQLPIAARLAEIEQLWEQASEFPAGISALIKSHQEAVQSGKTIRSSVERLVARLQTQVSENSTDLGVVYSEQTDVLTALRTSLQSEIPEPVITVDDVDPEEVDVRKRTVKVWKHWANGRGPKSLVFRQNVRRAYKSTCVVCGNRFPPTGFSAAGVDAAHILPWSQYDLDEVRNGLCLCKLHHWAFDEALIVLTHDQGRYAMVLPSDIKDRLEAMGDTFSLAPLQQAEGWIPEERLPRNKKDWPVPQLLDLLNAAQGA